MEFMTTPAVYHEREMDLSGGNGSLWEDNGDEYKAGQHTGFKKSHKMVSLFIYSLVFVLGVLGNGVVIWVTVVRMKKTVTTVWYLNLAAADFLVAASLPLGITYVALDEHWPFGNFTCKLYSMAFYTNMYASIYTLVAISGDRCACVVCPVWGQNHRTARKASWVSLGVWVLALALSSPQLIFRDTRPSDHDKDAILCYNNFALSDDNSTATMNLFNFRYGALAIARFLMGFVIPFTVIVACYSVIIYRLKNNRSLASQLGRSFKIIVTVIAVFFLCWAPYQILYLIKGVNRNTRNTDTLYLALGLGAPVTLGLGMLNSCLNPLLYVFMGQGFKDVFRRSILKALEKAFAEELPRNNTSTDTAGTRRGTTSSGLGFSLDVL